MLPESCPMACSMSNKVTYSASLMESAQSCETFWSFLQRALRKQMEQFITGLHNGLAEVTAILVHAKNGHFHRQVQGPGLHGLSSFLSMRSGDLLKVNVQWVAGMWGLIPRSVRSRCGRMGPAVSGKGK